MDATASRHGRGEELTPFLERLSSSGQLPEREHNQHPEKAGSRPWLLVVVLVISVALVSDIGEALYSVPKVRLFESAICARYYAQHDPSQISEEHGIPEHLCKLDPIQDWLAELLGWQLFFEGIPAILLPIPFGYLADQLGRRWILACALAGFALSYVWVLFIIGGTDLPTQWVWLSPAFYLFGGGPIVASNLLTTIVADVVPPKLRSTVFFYRFCTDFVANLAIPPIASYLMSKNMWISLLGGVLFQASSVIMALALPESAPAATSDESEHVDESPPIDLGAPAGRDVSSLEKRYKVMLRRTKSSVIFVLQDKAVASLIWAFLLFEIGLQSKQVLFQYASKRYGWTLAQAALLPSLRSAITIGLFTIILPGLTKYMSRSISRAAVKDLILSQGSVILLFLGTLVLASSVTPALMICGYIFFSMGSGFEPAARSLVTALVESNSSEGMSQIGALYAIISVVEGVGRLISALGMSLALRIGLHLGMFWYGLPFAAAAILFASIIAILFSINARQPRVSSNVR